MLSKSVLCLLQMLWPHLHALLLAIQCCQLHAFYVPGVAPSDFQKGDPVEIKVELESSWDHCDLFLCQSKHSLKAHMGLEVGGGPSVVLCHSVDISKISPLMYKGASRPLSSGASLCDCQVCFHCIVTGCETDQCQGTVTLWLLLHAILQTNKHQVQSWKSGLVFIIVVYDKPHSSLNIRVIAWQVFIATCALLSSLSLLVVQCQHVDYWYLFSYLAGEVLRGDRIVNTMYDVCNIVRQTWDLT